MFTCLKIRTLVGLAAVAAMVAGCSQQNQSADAIGHSSSYDANWGTNLEAALTKAKTANKLVLVDFTGSDWCPPCMVLHDKVLTQPAFLDYAKANLELVVMDFPNNKPMAEAQRTYNEGLAKKYNVDGYPTVIVFDAEGKELHREVGYSGADAAGYVAALKKKLNR